MSTNNVSREKVMNTIRMFVFAIAVLTTAFLLRVIVDDLSSEQPMHAAMDARGTAVSTDPQSAAGRSSP
jgi:hypothetical protein